MSLFDELITPSSETSVRSRILGYAQSAGLKITNWRKGGVGEQTFEYVVSAVNSVSSVVSKLIRGYASLDTSVDPGDVDPYDPTNETLSPEPGHLSVHGLNTFGTERIDEKAAAGTIIFFNAGPSARTISPYQLTFTWTVDPPPGDAPTYRNTPDSSIYTGTGGTLTVPPVTSIELPIECDTTGTRGSCPSGALSLTTSLIGCSAINSSPVVGNSREPASTYRARCRKAPSRLSLAGPAAIYGYLANTNLDGTPLLNASNPPAQVGINRVSVSEDSATGIVTVYFASAAGAPLPEDVTAANLNIQTYAFAVPDAITYSGIAATESTTFVSGSVKIKFSTGIDVSRIKSAIVAKLLEQWKEIPIGGMDSDGTSGKIYLNDIEGIVKSAWPGLYRVQIATPSGDTSISSNTVSVLNTSVGSWTVTVVP